MNKITKETSRIYWQHVLRYPWAAFLIWLGVTSASIVSTLRPLVYKRLLDTLAKGGTSQLHDMYMSGYLIAFLAIANWVAWRLASFAASYQAARVMSDLLNSCFTYLQDHSYSFFNNTFVGSLVTKVSRYSRSYEKVSDQFIWNVYPTILSTSLILFVLYQRRPILGYILIGWAAVYLTVNYFLTKKKLVYDVATARAETATTALLADTIANEINIKLFASKMREIASFLKLTKHLERARQQTWYFDSTTEAVQGIFMIALEIVVIFVAIPYWQKGILTVGDFALIQAYLLQIFNNLFGIGKYVRKIYEGMADAQEMTELLITPHGITDKPKATKLKVDQGTIDFRNVTFAYSKNKVLDGFNLTVKPGERLALIGQSGGGKTTIVKLLFRFFDIQDGRILIDDQNIAEVTQDSLRQHIALVPQEPILFHRSLLENIGYAKPNATKEEIIEAAKLAHCHEFISQFPEGYDTFVGERGVKLSGGERQRVAIARAILKDAPILVLDEATSSLDSESERYIQDALTNLMKGRTTVVIAHRLSTIMQMDRIVVIEKGKIAEEGTHHELLELNKGIYQKLWEIQAGSFNS